MKYLGIDYGTKRIGIALSDEEGSFAFPKAIHASPEALEEIVTILSKENITAIVIGYSVSTNGVENDMAKKAMKFKESLATKTGVPIVFEREDFSSVEAHRYQIKKGSRDDSAAAIILQRYLDKLPKSKKMPQ